MSWLKRGFESHSVCRLRICFHFLCWQKLSKCLCVVEEHNTAECCRRTELRLWEGPLVSAEMLMVEQVRYRQPFRLHESLGCEIRVSPQMNA